MPNSAIRLAAAFAAMVVTSGAANADVPISVIFQFSASAGTGTTPNGTMSFDSHGTLWGTTLGGPGAGGNGTVFNITTAGSLMTQFPFDCSTTGCQPNDGLAVDANGNLYGTTYVGPTNAKNESVSTVFKITKKGAVSRFVLLSPTKIGHTLAGLSYQNGVLYGINNENCEGPSGNKLCPSVLFKIALSNKEITTIPGPSDGFAGVANTSVALDPTGNVWVLAPGNDFLPDQMIVLTNEYQAASATWQQALVWNTGTAGCNAAGIGKPLVGPDGSVYVAAVETPVPGSCGSGWLLKLPPNGLPVLLAQFDPLLQGFPAGGVVMDESGALYGVTATGGGSSGRTVGIVYCISQEGNFLTLAQLPAGLNYTDGVGELTPDGKGSFYGVTNDAHTAGSGFAYKFAPGAACSP